MIQGSGSGSISLTRVCGSGSRRPKNIWIRRIQTRNSGKNTKSHNNFFLIFRMDDRRVNLSSSTLTGRCKWAACISALTACVTSLASWGWAGLTCPGAQDSPAVSGQFTTARARWPNFRPCKISGSKMWSFLCVCVSLTLGFCSFWKQKERNSIYLRYK